MAEKIRIYGDVSPKHEGNFRLIKGLFKCKNNNDTMEKMIEKVLPIAKKELTKSAG